jgi:predicted transcriptional regulator
MLERTTGEEPLADVDFLARSEHRVAVLDRLAVGPRTRRDLHEETGISQPTLGRVFGDFEDRHWVERRGHEYALTPGGELVRRAFGNLLDTVETVQRLDGVAEYMQADELGLDLRVFGDATITRPEPGSALAHLTRLEELWYGSNCARVVLDMVPPGSPVDNRNRTAWFEAGDQHYEAINTAEMLDRVLADPEIAEMFRVGLSSPRMRIYRYEGEIPVVFGMAEGRAFLAPKGPDGMPVALVESTDERVLSWVDEQWESYRALSTELTVEDLP